MVEKPFAQACENNKCPILGVLKRVFADSTRVLEIGSGTGQHAVYFAPNLPHVQWMTADLAENHPGIRMWIEEFPAPNLLPPVDLDVRQTCWPFEDVDGVFSANTAHIMHWPGVEAMFAGVARLLQPGGVFALYGPFNYGGKYTSESNARFDASLEARDPGMGIRDFEAVDALAVEGGFGLLEDNPMPANNRTLVWRKREG
jgi:SAM-dependent methyltransferase